MTSTHDVRIRPALGSATDVYLYPTIISYSQAFNIDAALKSLGLSAGFGVECMLAIISTRSNENAVDAALRKLDLSESHDIDAGFQKSDFTGSHQIDAWFKATIPSDVNIDAFLKALSVSELYELDLALQKLGLQSQYSADILLVLRNRISYSIGVLISLIPSMPRQFGIGVYLISPQKFDIAVSFEQFMAIPTFESFEAVSSFETLEVTPYFQEV